jgi:hypothetical protein
LKSFSNLNNDTCIDSNDNHDVLLDINACNMSTASCTSCNDLKHEIYDLKQVRDDMSTRLIEHNEKSANLEKVTVMSQNCDLIDACRENNYFNVKLNGSHIDIPPFKSLHNNMSDKDCDFCLVVMEDLAKLRNVYAKVASQLESTICELDELKARPSLLGTCLECSKLKLELDVVPSMLKSLRPNCLRNHIFRSLHLLVRFVCLSTVSLSMLSMRTSCSHKMLLISLHDFREPN